MLLLLLLSLAICEAAVADVEKQRATLLAAVAPVVLVVFAIEKGAATG